MLRLIVRSVVATYYLSYDRSSGATIDRTLGHRMPRVLVRSVTGCHDCSYDRCRRMQRSIDRTIGRRPSRLLIHRSLITITSRTISYDGSCHRYSPMFVIARQRVDVDRGMRPPLLEIVANLADRSHPGPIATNRTIQKSYDPV